MEKFRGKYRIPSARLQTWDYGWNAAYFVTICTGDREHYFGEIVDKKLQSSEIGNLADHYWYEIPKKFSYCRLDDDAFVVMPNHIHGIVVIDKSSHSREFAVNRRDAINRVSNGMGFNPPGGITGNKNPMLHDNLSRVMRWYKGRVSFESHRINPAFSWQSRFYDHIIRDEQSYRNISNYIKNNPANWRGDKFFE